MPIQFLFKRSKLLAIFRQPVAMAGMESPNQRVGGHVTEPGGFFEYGEGLSVFSAGATPGGRRRQCRKLRCLPIGCDHRL